MTDSDLRERLAALQTTVEHIRAMVDKADADRTRLNAEARLTRLETLGGSALAELGLEERKADRPEVTTVARRQDVDDALRNGSWRVVGLAVSVAGPVAALIGAGIAVAFG